MQYFPTSWYDPKPWNKFLACIYVSVHIRSHTAQPWYYADVNNIYEGIEILKKRGGSCTVGAGSRTCIDLTCDNNHEIVLYNDNDFPIHLNCDYLATYAEDIIDAYIHSDGFTSDEFACGESRVLGVLFSILEVTS